MKDTWLKLGSSDALSDSDVEEGKERALWILQVRDTEAEIKASSSSRRETA